MSPVKPSCFQDKPTLEIINPVIQSSCRMYELDLASMLPCRYIPCKQAIKGEGSTWPQVSCLCLTLLKMHATMAGQAITVSNHYSANVSAQSVTCWQYVQPRELVTDLTKSYGSWCLRMRPVQSNRYFALPL